MCRYITYKKAATVKSWTHQKGQSEILSAVLFPFFQHNITTALLPCLVFPLFYFSHSHQLRPPLPSRRAIQTPSPLRCVCSWRSAKSVRKLCRPPHLGASNLVVHSKLTLPRPKAPLTINQPGRTEGRSSKETKARVLRSPEAKDPKPERGNQGKQKERGVCHPCRMFLCSLNQFYDGSSRICPCGTHLPSPGSGKNTFECGHKVQTT